MGAQSLSNKLGESSYSYSAVFHQSASLCLLRHIIYLYGSDDMIRNSLLLGINKTSTKS
jgi:hypothetical protein